MIFDEMRAAARDNGQPGHQHTSTFPLWMAFIPHAILLFVVGAGSVHLLYAGWLAFPNLFATTGAKIGASLAVLVLGSGFHWLRENYQCTYALLELGAASATAFLAANETVASQDTLKGLVALLGALYIAVRGYDNLRKGYAKVKVKTA